MINDLIILINNTFYNHVVKYFIMPSAPPVKIPILLAFITCIPS